MARKLNLDEFFRVLSEEQADTLEKAIKQARRKDRKLSKEKLKRIAKELSG